MIAAIIAAETGALDEGFSVEWAALATAFVLLALNAFFVAAEFALLAARRSKIEQLAADGNKRAVSALAGIRELTLGLVRPGELARVLGKEATVARREAPSGLLGALTGFLDQDGDGSIQDDLLAKAGQAALGKLFGR